MGTSRHILYSRAALLAALASLCAIRPATPLQAQEQHPHHAPRQVKEQIDDLEEQWKNATVGGDAAALDKLLSDDYVGISWTGQINTKQMQIDRIRGRMIVIQSMSLSDIKVKIVGTVAIVTSKADVVGTSDGRPMDGAFRYTRIYQRLPSGSWKITNFEATRIPSERHNGERAHNGFPPPVPPAPGSQSSPGPTPNHPHPAGPPL